ncbi:hypothetical protein, partial [Mycobacterium marinum]|uniref:hypothetical protein n=1 Tax=Mycobacterium marinum TaxID=1781 RepID=UPI001AA08029
MKNRHRERFDTTVNAHIERCFVATDHKFIECDGIDGDLRRTDHTELVVDVDLDGNRQTRQFKAQAGAGDVDRGRFGVSQQGEVGDERDPTAALTAQPEWLHLQVADLAGERQFENPASTNGDRDVGDGDGVVGADQALAGAAPEEAVVHVPGDKRPGI